MKEVGYWLFIAYFVSWCGSMIGLITDSDNLSWKQVRVMFLAVFLPLVNTVLFIYYLWKVVRNMKQTIMSVFESLEW